MNLRVTAARLALPLIVAMSAGVGAQAAESPFAAFKKIVSLPQASREAAVGKLKLSSERYRKIVQAKVREYAAMPEAERCLLYTSPSPRDKRQSRMPSSA